MESLEVSAKTVEDAVDSALRELGLNRSEVEVEVLQEGIEIYRAYLKRQGHKPDDMGIPPICLN